ncbi:hypothetical protein B566_EDAN009910 [Ephemera danica]|nr:hypothetical protein B566_EDAN009910 [Ephemera danica]
MEPVITETLDLGEAKKSYLDIYARIGPSSRSEFLEWVQSPASLSSNETKAEAVLHSIVVELRSQLPADSVLPSETLLVPTHGDNSDCLPECTLHVDAFLYDEDDVEELVDQGKISRNFCTKLAYIFTALLPPLDGMTVLDVGSRIGAALYAAHVYSTAASIVGIEMNHQLCQIQQDIVNKFGLQKRVQVVESDVLLCSELVHSSDVILLNNVFEFFLSETQQVACWRFLRDNVKPGALLANIDLDTWVCSEEPYAEPHPARHEEAMQVNLYRVLDARSGPPEMLSKNSHRCRARGTLGKGMASWKDELKLRQVATNGVRNDSKWA